MMIGLHYVFCRWLPWIFAAVWTFITLGTISTGEDRGYARLRLWRASLLLLGSAPLVWIRPGPEFVMPWRGFFDLGEHSTFWQQATGCALVVVAVACLVLALLFAVPAEWRKPWTRLQDGLASLRSLSSRAAVGRETASGKDHYQDTTRPLR